MLGSAAHFSIKKIAGKQRWIKNQFSKQL